jgi:hypothetical protein
MYSSTFFLKSCHKNDKKVNLCKLPFHSQSVSIIPNEKFWRKIKVLKIVSCNERENVWLLFALDSWRRRRNFISSSNKSFTAKQIFGRDQQTLAMTFGFGNANRYYSENYNFTLITRNVHRGFVYYSGAQPFYRSGNFKMQNLSAVKISWKTKLKYQLYTILGALQCFKVFSDLGGHLKKPQRAKK